MIRSEARQFSALWFRYLSQEEPQKAFQLYQSPQFRQPLDDRLWDYYRHTPQQRDALNKFVKLPVVRTLLALGPKAQVRFYQTGGEGREDDNDWVDQYYAATYEEQGERKSFFVLVHMSRQKLGNGQAGWRSPERRGRRAAGRLVRSPAVAAAKPASDRGTTIIGRRKSRIV